MKNMDTVKANIKNLKKLSKKLGLFQFMKNMAFPLLIVVLLFPFVSWAEVFSPYAAKEIPGAFYFTPAASSKEFALFGYMSKITPTPEEIKAEQRRISAIIDEGVKREYGSWKNLEEAMPFLVKGALLYAKAHPEAMREPVGSVGETGVVAVNSWGEITKIPLGINAPVLSIDITPDGWMAAVLTDMGFEDKEGRLHPLGEISLIDLKSKMRIHSWVFPNLAEHVAFVPAIPNLLAFDCYKDRKDFSKRELRFIDLKNKRVTKYRLPIDGSGSGSIFGKNVRYPGFVFAPDKPIVALYSKGTFELRDIFTRGKLFKVVANSHVIAFANRHPWIFTGTGKLWNYKDKKLLGAVKLRFDNIPLREAKFSKDDRRIFYLDGWHLTRLDTTDTGEIIKKCESRKPAGLFFLTPDERFAAAFVQGKGMASYKKDYLKRQRLCLRIFDTKSLQPQQDMCFQGSTVVDAAMAQNTMIVSDFDRLHVYAYASGAAFWQHLPDEPENSLLSRIAKNPGKFAGKIIELDGWAWGWMAQAPKAVKGKRLPFARNNYGSRMDGTFTDGTVRILYPVPVRFSGPLHIKARVVVTPGGWQLVPVQ